MQTIDDPAHTINDPTPPRTRRGFTLPELLVALALLGVVSTGIYRVLVATQRAAHAQAQWIDLQRNLRAAATFLPAELRELAASDGDIYAMSDSEIHLRAMRQLSVICQEPPLGGRVVGLPLVVFREPLTGRRFEPLDSILLFYEGDEGTADDDGWVSGVVTSAMEVSCPDGSPGDELLVNVRLPTGVGAQRARPLQNRVRHPTDVGARHHSPQQNRPGAIPRGGPIRSFEPVRYAAYRAGDGLWYLGQEVPGSSIQPLIGPLDGERGLAFRYRDVAGSVTTVPGNVALVEIRVRGRTVAPVWDARRGRRAVGVDSVVIQVALRNNGEW